MKTVKKCVFFFLALFLFTTFAYAAAAPEILANAAVVVEPSSGEILYEKNAHEKTYPASTTKMMTGLIAMEKGKLDDVVTVSASALHGLEEMGSGTNLRVGETYTLHDLLYLLLLPSDNDAANVIAEHIAGSQDAFVEMMNERAQQIGMKDTHFSNVHGLHDENHYTTAYDMSLLAREALKNSLFAEIAKTPRAVINGEEILTTNHLISRFKDPNYYYSYAIGIKTGFTTPAGHCLVSAAEKNGSRYVCVVMNSPQDKSTGKIGSFTDTKALFEWAFSNFEEKTLLSKSTPVQEVPVRLAQNKDYLVLTPEADLKAIVPKDLDPKSLTFDYEVQESITAPVKKGEALGKVTVSSGDKTYGTLNLIALNDVERSTFLYVLDRIKSFFNSLPFRIVLIVLVALFILLLVIRTINKRRRRYRNQRMRYGGGFRRR